MKPFYNLIPFEEAQRIILENILPLKRTEKVKLEDSSGRVLAQSLVAILDHPSFDRSAMDGYAVKAEDTFGASQSQPKVFTLVGIQHAGRENMATPEFKVTANQCVQIATGAKIPPGANAVVEVEDTERENDQVKVFKSVYPGANISLKGEDIKKGEVILEKENFLDTAKIGVLASQGMNEIEVYQKPVVAILPTGEEVAEVGRKLAPGQVYDINSYTISAIVQENGGLPKRLGIVADNIDSLNSAMGKVVNYDLAISSGGSSVGEKDLLSQVIQDSGEVLFHGVQIRPGMPVLFGKINGKPVFGMPGFATSCLLNAYHFILPAVRKMSHLPPKRIEQVKVRLSQQVSGSPGRKRFLTVKLEKDSSGNKVAIPVFKESGAITSMSRADGYIEIDKNVDLIEKGEEVIVSLF
jgi:molybdenum cofactor synthesis domain-containing protein